MRASKAHREHNEETKRLIGDLEQKNRVLNEMAAAKAGDAVKSSHAILVTSNEALPAAAEAAQAALRVLNEHIKKPTDFVRNYRILDLEDGAELDRFSASYELAPLTASKRMFARQISRYNLQEQLPDGTWVPYYPQKMSSRD